MTRGPLSAGVYWRRRVVLFAVAFVLVVGIARVLGSGGGSGTDQQAQQTSAQISPTVPVVPSQTGMTKPKVTPSPTARPTALASPVGTCANSDITVTPTVGLAEANRTVPLVLNLTTIDTPACTWNVSAANLALKVTDGATDVWTSQQCPRFVPNQEVVVRQAVTTPVIVEWDGRRSDEGCTDQRTWVAPGIYHVYAAALAGKPTQTQFEITTPEDPTSTAIPPFGASSPTGSPTAHPTGSASGSTGGSASGSPTAHPSGSASAHPSGGSSGSPSAHPSGSATGKPTSRPSGSPSGKPSGSGTARPSGSATAHAD